MIRGNYYFIQNTSLVLVSLLLCCHYQNVRGARILWVNNRGNFVSRPMEEQRQRYGPPLYSLTKLVLNIRLFLSLLWRRFDAKQKWDSWITLGITLEVFLCLSIGFWLQPFNLLILVHEPARIITYLSWRLL